MVLPTGPLNSHFHTTYARHRAQLQMFVVNDPLVCSRLQSAAGVCWLHSSSRLLHTYFAAQMRRETCWTTAGAATCRIHSVAGQLLGEVNAAGCCCFSCVDFLNCARLWLGCCCWLLLFMPQACVAVTLSCSACSAAVFNAECSSSCVW